MRVLFHNDGLNLRGTTVAIYNYIVGLQKLNIESGVIFHKYNIDNDSSVIDRFNELCPVYSYENFSEIDSVILREGFEYSYFMKSGDLDGKISKEAVNLIHCVFPTHWRQIHGDRFVYISEWLSKICSNKALPWVPYIVNISETNTSMREMLGIPHEACVFGCYGGSDSFDIKFVQQGIIDALSRRRDLYIIFMNISSFAKHERLMFLPGSSDPEVKSKFIKTCDAMIHARLRGETFGLACAEFSMLNRPVLTYLKSNERAHLEILGSRALLYHDQKSLISQLVDFDCTWAATQNWDQYTEFFSEKVVSRKFVDVFLNQQEAQSLNFIDKFMTNIYRKNQKKMMGELAALNQI